MSYLQKITITNSANDTKDIRWFIVQDRDDTYHNRHEVDYEIEEWHKNPGAMSVRDYYDEVWDLDDCDTLTLDDLSGIPLKMLAKVLDYARIL